MKVCLASMPFGPLFSPSIALGLLKELAKKHAYDVDVHYFNLDFAKLIGERFYHDIASGLFPTHYLIGEWIFSACLHEKHWAKNDCFIDDVIKPLFKSGVYGVHERNICIDDFIHQILLARKVAKQFIEECTSEILESSPSIVGITSVFQQHAASLALAKQIKLRNPSTFVVLGGANCEGAMGRAVIGYAKWVDAVVSGEGERAFEYVLRQIKNDRLPAQMANLHLQSHHRIPLASEVREFSKPIHLDELPIPDYAEFFKRIVTSGVDHSFLRLQIPFETSRGCWWGEKHHCTFCGLNGQSMTFRSKSADRAYDELMVLSAAYPEKVVGVTDNILDMEYFKEFLPKLSRSSVKPELFYEVKANLNIKHLDILRSAGVTHIQPGIESFSDEVLGLMRKGVRAIQNVQLLRDCAETGVVPEWNLLWGFPGESAIEYEHIAAILPSIFHLRPPTAASQLRLDRFSPLFESAEELGVVAPRPTTAYEYVYPFSTEILEKLAYYFDFTYVDERNVDSYVSPIISLIKQWKEEHRSSELVSIDKGMVLLIWDTRSSRHKPLIVLEGVKREIYLHLSKAISRSKIFSMFESEFHEFISELIEELLRRRLIVEIGGRVLAVSLPLERYDPSPDGLAALIMAIREVSGDPSDDDNLTVPLHLYGCDTQDPPNIAFKWGAPKTARPFS